MGDNLKFKYSPYLVFFLTISLVELAIASLFLVQFLPHSR